jgi:polysaccharide biosynthesis/export protein
MMFARVLRPFRSIPIAVGLYASMCGFLLATGAAFGQVPSSQQLDIYRNLNPDQQRAIMESLSRGGTSGSPIADRKIQFPETVRPRRDDDDDTDSPEFDRRLKAGDTLLLYLEIRKFESLDDLRALQQQQAAESMQASTPGGVALPGQQAANPSPQSAQQSGASGQTDDRSQITHTTERLIELNEFRERIQRRNPVQLDSAGALDLPEIGAIPLAGLTVEEAQERLAVVEQLRDYRITVLKLPLAPQGTAAVKPFGYDLFAGSPSTFAPATDIPVPADYVVGPGDAIHAQLIGNKPGNYVLMVDREGKVNFPELGPIVVGGMRFNAMRDSIERRVREQMIGTRVSISLGELRSIRIFVLGDAERPGSYTVSGLSTMTNALFVSGGVKEIGSLRNIQLKRNGELVTKLDLYDLLLKGDTRSDARLLPGDVIFIPPVGNTVAVTGAVRRPAIYELVGETTAQEVIGLAGGLTAEADTTLATVERIDEQRRRITVSLNLASDGNTTTAFRNSDVVRIPTVRPSLEQSVSLVGYVHRPGNFQYRPGMRLSDLISSVDEIKPNGDQHYVLIRRELEPNRRLQVLSADLSKAWVARGGSQDIELAPRDRIYVFDVESGRDTVVQPLMRELRIQSSLDAPTSEVRVGGRVKVPGRYPLEPGMRISDLIRAGGSMDEAAYEGAAELTRYTVVNGESRQTELINIDLKKIRAGDVATNIVLQPFDYLVVKEIPLWKQLETVEIRGEVRFPGKYPIHRGETLRSVIERAGGLTESAFTQGAVFTRQELKERERKQIELLANRMQSDIAQLSLQAAQETGRDVGQALAVGQSMLTALKATQPVGRLVIDLKKSLRTTPGSTSDVVLKEGDLLMIPRQQQEVTVLGEVQSVTSHFYSPNIDRDEYINMSGGLTQRADKKRIYVVKADGSVMAKSGSAWFSQSSMSMDAGDTIVVPLDAERIRLLPIVQSVTSIVSNLAISAAALSAL